MTNEMVLERTSNLVMPLHYVELDRDEMSYVDGGLSTSAVACIIDVGLIAIAGVINLGIKAAGWFGKGALKRTLLKKAPGWARKLLGITAVSTLIQSCGGNIATIIGMFDNLSPYIDRIVTACSIGGIIATVLDIADGQWNGDICFG